MLLTTTANPGGQVSQNLVQPLGLGGVSKAIITYVVQLYVNCSVLCGPLYHNVTKVASIFTCDEHIAMNIKRNITLQC